MIKYGNETLDEPVIYLEMLLTASNYFLKLKRHANMHIHILLT